MDRRIFVQTVAASIAGIVICPNEIIASGEIDEKCYTYKIEFPDDHPMASMWGGGGIDDVERWEPVLKACKEVPESDWSHLAFHLEKMHKENGMSHDKDSTGEQIKVFLEKIHEMRKNWPAIKAGYDKQIKISEK